IYLENEKKYPHRALPLLQHLNFDLTRLIKNGDDSSISDACMLVELSRQLRKEPSLSGEDLSLIIIEARKIRENLTSLLYEPLSEFMLANTLLDAKYNQDYNYDAVHIAFGKLAIDEMLPPRYLDKINPLAIQKSSIHRELLLHIVSKDPHEIFSKERINHS